MVKQCTISTLGLKINTKIIISLYKYIVTFTIYRSARSRIYTFIFYRAARSRIYTFIFYRAARSRIYTFTFYRAARSRIYTFIIYRPASYIELYPSITFCSQYRKLIIMILAIISVIVEQCDRNTPVSYVCPLHNKSPAHKSGSGDLSVI